ncbi:hypothetical protein PT974_04332 [Cladobotryum mycophilum]|uniref:Uncharacterized protein n=1 Tax=Cladobotryum mycophilum TaxID=491253 RepID=A0ABR0SUW3_9HYPO
MDRHLVNPKVKGPYGKDVSINGRRPTADSLSSIATANLVRMHTKLSGTINQVIWQRCGVMNSPQPLAVITIGQGSCYTQTGRILPENEPLRRLTVALG